MPSTSPSLPSHSRSGQRWPEPCGYGLAPSPHGGFGLGADIDHVRLAAASKWVKGRWRFMRWLHEIPCHNSFFWSRYHSGMKPHSLTHLPSLA